MELFDIIKIIFREKYNWHLVKDEDKKSIFYVFNLYMSKDYPLMANSLNVNGINEIHAMDTWFEYFKNKKVFYIFPKKIENEDSNIKKKYKLSNWEIDFLKTYEPEQYNNQNKYDKTNKKSNRV